MLLVFFVSLFFGLPETLSVQFAVKGSMRLVQIFPAKILWKCRSKNSQRVNAKVIVKSAIFRGIVASCKILEYDQGNPFPIFLAKRSIDFYSVSIEHDNRKIGSARESVLPILMYCQEKSREEKWQQQKHSKSYFRTGNRRCLQKKTFVFL